MSISTLIDRIPLSPGLNPIDTPLKQFIYGSAKAHNEEYTPCAFKTLPKLTEIDELCTFGVFSQTLMQSRKQYLLASGVINIDGAYTTITNVSRLYLDYYHPNKLRSFGALTRDTYELPAAPPLYIVPSIIQHGAYVDIKSTYFNILLNVGWDLSFWLGRWLTPGRKPLDFPLKENKPARSYLVTGCLKSAVGIWDGHNAYFRHTRNRHINYELWGYVTSTLHCIAQYAVLYCDARYVHTDGYIVPMKYADDLIAHIASWGLRAEIKAHGETMINGFANYICGEKRTKVFHPDRKRIGLNRIRWDVPAIWVRDATIEAINRSDKLSRHRKIKD
jgi:hypothetical protein